MIHRPLLALLPALAAALLAAPASSQTPPAPSAPPDAPLARAERLHRIAAELAPMPGANRSTQVFQVTLLLASASGQSSPELPKAAREAVESLRDFLPYKSYSVLDFAWVRTAGMSQTQVKGPDGRAFQAVLRYDDPDDNEGRLFIRDFRLEEISDDEPGFSSGAGSPPGAGSRVFLRPSRALISTSFGMEIGETVVVGTSRLNGDGKALVVLLTAIPASVTGS